MVGHAPTIGAGEWITATGAWVNDRTHGLQFKAEVLKATPPTGAEGIEKYLASGQMRGIGPAMAKRIVAAFGEATFEIIEASPERLTEVSGIGPWRASRIVAGWAEQKAVREIMIFLHAHGVGTARAVRIFKTYGHEAIKVMTEDPYRLARDVRGIGFRTADAIAAKLGMEKTAPQRLRAGVSFALQTAMDEGHCGLPVDDAGRPCRAAAGSRCRPDPTSPSPRNSGDGEEVIERHGRGRAMRLPQGPASRPSRAIADRLIDASSRRHRPGPRSTSTRPCPGSRAGRARRFPPSQREAVRLVLALQGRRDHGRSWRRQDQHARHDPAHPGRQRRAGCCSRLQPAGPPSA